MNDPNGKDRPDNWERDALLKVALAGVEEQRRGRRWGIFFKLLGFAYLFLILALVMSDGPGTPGTRTGSHTALVDVEGPIAAGTNASAETVVRGLRAAFEDKNTKAVLLRINSPGGSPVQAGQVNDEIRRLREKHPDIPLYAAVQDLCASGAYYIAVAADEIYVDKASLVGSIGVRMDGFGLVDAIDRLGIERRLLTAGEHKGMLDPFLPVDPAEQKHVQGLLETIHRQFV
ncbi:MAG: S49 family peptidase, partial [Ectothiorhodospiraceae bacterium]|nr:S49 family peptidase [Ectothiorhodospiraceae bacterium]